MVEHLTRDLGSLRHGDHLCLPYDHVDEKTDAVIPFIADGLGRGERCVYIADPDQREALLGALSNAGVNASRALDRGSLWLRTPQETYLRSGKFDPDDMLALLDELITGAQTDGFVGLRGSGEASATEDHGISWSDLDLVRARLQRAVRGPADRRPVPLPPGGRAAGAHRRRASRAPDCDRQRPRVPELVLREARRRARGRRGTRRVDAASAAAFAQPVTFARWR